MEKDSPEPETRAKLLAESPIFVVLIYFLDQSHRAEHDLEHTRWVKRRTEEGLIMLSGAIEPQENSTSLDGMALLRANSIAEARDVIEQDPFVANGIYRYEILVWKAH
jgi:uncharacterized protein